MRELPGGAMWLNRGSDARTDAVCPSPCLVYKGRIQPVIDCGVETAGGVQAFAASMVLAMTSGSASNSGFITKFCAWHSSALRSCSGVSPE